MVYWLLSANALLLCLAYGNKRTERSMSDIERNEQ